ncbi:TetR family transcriptional regulator [Streptomyces sp. NPDC126514]|uniref:TetR/AcrR family transcriptional regulator n=1 Tax=Streptomyces sp. NPDC126514 TaxID=3155210 RepID=UPI00332939F7
MDNAAPARRRIVDAVVRIIGQDGIAALTNRRIAREAAVSLGSITYHFPTQHELLRESLVQFVDEEIDRLSRLADACSGGGQEAGGAVQAVQEALQTPQSDHTCIASFELYLQAWRDERLQVPAAQCFAAYDRLAERILKALGVPDAGRLATTVVCLVFGQQLRRLATGSVAGTLADALAALPQLHQAALGLGAGGERPPG